MKIEHFFLRYAYPCAYVLMQRQEITQEELQELEEAAIQNQDVPRERLEKVFHRAFDFIDQLAKKRNKQRWDLEVIKEYFYSYHNEVIGKGEGIYATAPHTIKELSRVDTATVIAKKGDVLIVQYQDWKNNLKTRNVFNHFVPRANIGDKVTIHYGYAVEIIGSE